jgi:hypothetical protein
MTEKETKIEELLRDKRNNFPIPLQHILVDDLEEKKNETPHIKLVPVKKLQTLSYPINALYKPISRML